MHSLVLYDAPRLQETFSDLIYDLNQLRNDLLQPKQNIISKAKMYYRNMPQQNEIQLEILKLLRKINLNNDKRLNSDILVHYEKHCDQNEHTVSLLTSLSNDSLTPKSSLNSTSPVFLRRTESDVTE